MCCVLTSVCYCRHVRYAEELHRCQQTWDELFLEQCYGAEAAEQPTGEPTGEPTEAAAGEAAGEAADKATTNGVRERSASEPATPEQTT